MSNQPTRIGLFGGTFDPPHAGHRTVADAASYGFDLAQVWWAPVGRQPLKSTQPIATFADRMKMVQLACEACPHFIASDIDAPRADGTLNYTVDTLARLHELHPEVEWWNIVGADSFLDLHRWKDPDRLLELAKWVVVSRPGFDLKQIDQMKLPPLQRTQIYQMNEISVPVSSTHLRDELKHGAHPRSISANVMDFIERKGLYR